MVEFNCDTVKVLQGALVDVAERASRTFTGLAIVVYEKGQFSSRCHCDLRDASSLLPMDSPYANVGDGLADLLLTISCESHPCHDGFVLMNELGQVTHLAQYFVPPIVPNLAPHNGHGTRFYSALCGSLLPGVNAIGVICSNRDCFLMRSGGIVFERIIS